MAIVTTGIYIITNCINGKVYIGSTAKKLKRRWEKHRRDLRGKRHHNPHLQAAWNKYGEAVFEFGVLEYLDNPEELHLAEQFWMDVYREEGKQLYNYGFAARHPMLGRNHTKETLQKMRKAQLGKILSEEHKHKMSLAHKGIKHTKETRLKMSRSKGKSYPAFIHKETNEIIPAGVDLSAMCRRNNLTRSSMGRVAAGEYNQHKGWKLLTSFSEV